MILGRDGTSIVSVYITNVAMELRIARVFQAEAGILSAFLTEEGGLSVEVESTELDVLSFFNMSSNFFQRRFVGSIF
jgi:hypothetical protein